jgi:hypothetical protein
MTTSFSLKSTNDLISLFSQTLHSISEDAIAVKQVSSLKLCLDHDSEEGSTGNRQEELIEQLWHIQDLVTGLEGKVTALRKIVSEEKRSIAKFESSLMQEAQEQDRMMEQMLHALQEYELHHRTDMDHSHSDSSSLHSHISSLHSDASSTLTRVTHSSDRLLAAGSRRDSVDPRSTPTHRLATTFGLEVENQDPISVPRITQDELEAYKADTVRAPRISLMDLNEALEEIEQVVQLQRQAAQILRRKQQKSGLGPNALQRRYDYLEKRQQHAHASASDDSSTTSVTEQELRENCAFFRHGESTARSTLSLLCRLRRLKQFPAKNQQVIYQLVI